MSRINTIVQHTVYLGQGRIGDKLVIGTSGGVYPTQSGYGANAIVSDVSGAKIINSGMVVGGYGSQAIVGGIGVDLQAQGTLNNHGSITGGLGSYGTYSVNMGQTYDGSNGGVGVDLADGGC
jgi:hypothetical protein